MWNRIVQWVFENKAVTLLSVLLFSFVVSTIAVAVTSSNRLDDLNACKIQLAAQTSTTSTTTTKEPLSTEETTDSKNTTEVNNTTTEPPSTTPISNTNYRLPSGAYPTHYTITLDPNLDNSTFEGTVEIEVIVERDVNKLVLHSNSLDLQTLQLKTRNGTSINATFELAGDDTEFLTVYPVTSIASGSYILEIKYNGKMDGIVGLYSSSLQDGKKIATSKFEPTYARQAFPCFDEPAMKANYTVKLYTPNDYIALSNTDEVSRVNVTSSKSLVTFSESVPMSTYLVCFIVCNFEYEEEQILPSVGKNFSMRVYATHEQKSKVNFSLEVGKKVTEYYITYFEEEYPLPKLDMIAIPDFVSGAMEHWGLVTFRETNLLYDPATTSPSNKQNIARVVAHEVAHMWFGNLVTMNWWNELWLNEGFASYMQYKAVDKILPEWKMMDQFLTSNSHSVYAFDGTLSSHPIVQTVETPDEITTIFDSITYNKGAAVIRMLEGFVGEEDFRKGVSNYLKRHKYKNTVTQDLLDELEKIFGPKNPDRNITYIMDTWTRQTGLPVIKVAKKDANTYTLTQKRFLADPDTKPESPSVFNDRWYVPITYRTDKENNKTLWFPDNQTSVELKLASGEKLLKINNDQVGYFRVNYEADMWTELEKEVTNNNTKLTVMDKAHVVNDAFALAEASELNYSVPLQLAAFLTEETDYVPWAVASSQFGTMKRIMANSIAFIEFKKYVRDLLEKSYNTVGWDNKNETAEEKFHVQKLARASILGLACSMGHAGCLEEAGERFKKFINDATHPVDANLKGAVYYYGIEKTGEAEWLKLWDLFIKEGDAQEKAKLMSALAASSDTSILQRYLTLAWEEKYVRGQDHLSVIQQVAANPAGTALAWDHLRDNWLRLVDKFTLNSRVLGTTVPAVTRSFATQAKLKEVEDFFAQYPDAGAGASPREQTKENIRNNIKWLKTHEPTVREWLQKNVKP